MATAGPKFQRDVETSKTDPLTEVIVRGKSVQTFPTLHEAGQHYVKEYFPMWSKRRTACIVPPIPWTAYNRSLGPQLGAADGAVKSNERGDNAELAVCKNIFSCGEMYEEPMFLLAQVDWDPENKSKQTLAVVESFLPSTKRSQLMSVSKKLDIDLTIIHTNIGVIVIEVKAAENPLVDIGNAVTSLRKAEGLLRLFDESVPIYKVVAFPNCVFEKLSEHQKAEIERLRLKDDFMFCDMTFTVHPEVVAKLFLDLKTKTLEQGCPNLTERTDTLLHWLISLKCLVSSTVRDRKVTKVILKDEAVNVTKQVKQTDVKLVQHDVYSKSVQKRGLVRKVKIATEVLYLNPEQIAIWDGPTWQIVHGVAGTGKTVLIKHKVLELDRICGHEDHIAVIATDAVSREYENLFSHNKTSKRVEVYSKVSFLFQLSTNKGFGSKFHAYHIFIDETQNMLEITDFLSEIGKNKMRLKYLWVALDPIQALDKQQVISVERLSAELQISSLHPLRHVMRCTPEVTHYWSKYIPADCPIQYNQGNRLFVQDVPVYYAESNEQVVELLYSMLETYTDGENVTYKDCAILIHSPPMSLIPVRRGILGKIGLSENDYFLGQTENMITIRDLPNDIWSLEWSYVFIVAQDAKLNPTVNELDAILTKPGYWDSGIYLASSRCKVQLFLISLEKGRRLNTDLTAIKPSRVTYSFTYNKS